MKTGELKPTREDFGKLAYYCGISKHDADNIAMTVEQLNQTDDFISFVKHRAESFLTSKRVFERVPIPKNLLKRKSPFTPERYQSPGSISPTSPRSPDLGNWGVSLSKFQLLKIEKKPTSLRKLAASPKRLTIDQFQAVPRISRAKRPNCGTFAVDPSLPDLYVWLTETDLKSV